MEISNSGKTELVDLAHRKVTNWQIAWRAITAIISNAMILGGFLIAPIIYIVYSILVGLLSMFGVSNG